MNRATLCSRLSFGTQAASFCTELVEGGTESILLAHLSKENNFPELAYATTKNVLTKNEMIIGKDLTLDVLSPATVYDLLVAFLHRIWYGMNQAVGHPAFVKLAARFWSSGRRGITKRPPQSGGLRQGYVEMQDSRYSQSERAASSATTAASSAAARSSLISLAPS